jgi:hypothetical protein
MGLWTKQDHEILGYYEMVKIGGLDLLLSEYMETYSNSRNF